MRLEAVMQEQSEQLTTILDRLAKMLEKVRSAFIHQQPGQLDSLQQDRQDLLEEIAFAGAQADDRMFGLALKSRRRFYRYQSILAHLDMAAGAIASLGEATLMQIRDGIPFSDQAVQQVTLLFEYQKNILDSLTEAVKRGDRGPLRQVIESSRELCRYCLRFGTHHETRLVEGLCLPRSAPLFLSILDWMQTLSHHEVETVKLLNRWLRKEV